MCGFIGFSGKFNNKLLEKCLQTLSHRGPDSNGIKYISDANIGFCHTRLSIIDLSDEGNQPMVSNNGNIIVFNGEIYNFKELKDDLIQQGVKFKSQTDTEVLLNLYDKYGSEITNYLNGIFSFAIFNKKLNQTFIARDNFGVKPLYYFQNSNGVVFGSEIKAIMEFIDFSDGQICKKSVRNHLSYLFNPNKTVMIKNLNKLSPGEYLIIENGEVISRKIWFNLAKRKIKNKFQKKSYKNQFIENFKNAVHRQMISDVPVGALLSGGLDSSSIVTFASQINNQLPCFTIVNNNHKSDGFVDDLPYAKKVSKILNVPLFEVEVNSSDIIDNLYKSISILEEPVADPAALNVLLISQLAKSQKIKVLLSGAGGDDVLTGYRRHTALRINQIFELFPLIPFKLIRKLKFNNLSSSNIRRMEKFINNLGLQGNNQIINYFKWTNDSLINSLFIDKNKTDFNNDNEMNDFLNMTPKNLSKIEKMLLIEKRFFLSDHNLLYNDKMSMASSIEIRVPFLDIEFENFCNEIPLNFKQKIFQNKWILKKAMEKYLPKEIIYRSKTGFGSPIRSWVRNELKDFINDILSESNIKKRNLFDYGYIKNLIKDNLDYKVDASYTIFSLVCIEIWFQIFIDKTGPTQSFKTKVA